MSERTESRQENSRELERLRRRCEELEYLLGQYVSQADDWREVASIVQGLFGSYNSLIFIYEPGSGTAGSRIKNANDAACGVLGYSREEILAMTLESVCAPGHLARLAETAEMALGENGVMVEVELVTREGHDLPVELSLCRYSLQGVEHVLCVGRDIRDRRAAEEALRASEEKYRVLVENINDVLFTIDTSGQFTYVSPAVERISGYHHMDLIGKNLSGFVVPEDFEALVGGLTFDEEGRHEPVEFRVVDKNGELRYVRSSGRLLREGSRTVGITGNIIDISRERTYKQTLEESARRLRDFLSVASHELRHPITIIKGYAQLMSTDLGKMHPDKARGIFQSMERNIDHLNRLGDELLDVSRIEEERFTVRRRVVDPERLVREVVEELRARGCAEPVVIIDPDLGKIKVDRDKIKRLLIILMENAFKYSPRPGTVRLEAGRKGTQVFISVLDRGPGVPPGEEKKIFERFYQVDDVFHHSKPGIGLGLYIGHEIVSGHGGRIWYEPRRGGGAAFRLTLP